MANNYDPNNYDPEFRFNETNFQYLDLNPRDWSLVLMAGIPMGMNYRLAKLEQQLAKKERIIESLLLENKGLSSRYDKKPWSGDRV